MKFPQALEEGRLIKRYKRFLCDVYTREGKHITIHCPNTGTMKNCCPNNARVWYSTSENPKRKYAHTWELVQDEHTNMIGINTHLANKIVLEALKEGTIKQFADFKEIQTEVPYGEENSRIDILLLSGDGQRNFIEVKSVTLLEDDGWGYFPDAVSTRGQKHLRELINIVEQGDAATLFFCVQHSGIHKMKAAAHIDKAYAELLTKASKAGVNIIAYACRIDLQGVSIQKQIPVCVD